MASADATKVTIRVRDETGKLVFQGAGEPGAGRHSIPWDGRDLFGNWLPDGLYRAEITATGAGGQDMPVATTIRGVVDGVETQGERLLLSVDGVLVGAGSDHAHPARPGGNLILGRHRQASSLERNTSSRIKCGDHRHEPVRFALFRRVRPDRPKPVDANEQVVNPNQLEVVDVDLVRGSVAATTTAALGINLDATQAGFAGAYAAGDMADFNSSGGASGAPPRFTRAIDVVDSLGRPHALTAAFLFYTETQASGSASLREAGKSGAGKLAPAALEAASVDIAEGVLQDDRHATRLLCQCASNHHNRRNARRTGAHHRLTTARTMNAARKKRWKSVYSRL